MPDPTAAHVFHQQNVFQILSSIGPRVERGSGQQLEIPWHSPYFLIYKGRSSITALPSLILFERFSPFVR